MSRKTLLQINSVVNKGSTGRIVNEIGQLAMEKGWDSYIAHGPSDGQNDPSLIEIGSRKDLYLHVLKTRLFDLHGFGSREATTRLIRLIEKVKPDIIALHNLHGYYINIEILFSFLRRYKRPIFWTLYDCWAFTGHCAYFDLVNCSKWKNHCGKCPAKHKYPQSWFVDNSKDNYERKKRTLLGIENLNLIVHSNWLKDNVNQSFLQCYPVHLINNGINLLNFRPFPSEDIIVKYNLQTKFIILGVANRWSERKGFSDFLALSKYLKDDEVILLDGLDGKRKRLLPNNIFALERAKNVHELAKLYSSAGVFFNPTHEDNFPTTNLEALACGTPVITYNAGGSPEALDSKTGFVTEKGDIMSVRLAIDEVRKKGKAGFTTECINRASKKFNYKDRYMDYVLLFEKCLYQ